MSTEQTNQPTLMDAQAQPAEQTKAETTTAVTKKEKYTPELCASAISKLPTQLQALKNCFAQPFDSFRNAFKDPKEADRVMAKEIEFASQAMMANSYLIKCANANPLSLVNALKNVALTGSTLNPVLKQGYLVPFGNSITFMPSYMGLVDVLVNNGLVKKVEAHCVFDTDEFSIEIGTNGHLIHKPDCWGKRTKENLKGAYYYVVLTDGTEMYDTMSVDEIEVIRKRAPSAKSNSPWDTDYAQMCAKTLIRRAFKMIPKNGISEDKVKALEAVFDYDEKVEQNWITEQKAAPKKDTFDEDEVEYEEMN